jgi:hypothetical protein
MSRLNGLRTGPAKELGWAANSMIKEKVRIRYSFRGGFRKVTTTNEEFFDNLF